MKTLLLESPSKLESEDVLNILKTIKENPDVTQRQLSSSLGISLGKVNFLLKALVERGLVKVDSFKKSNNKNAYLYYLTPKGVEAKAKTTFFFLKRKMAEYEALAREIGALKQEMAESTGHQEQSEEFDKRP